MIVNRDDVSPNEWSTPKEYAPPVVWSIDSSTLDSRGFLSTTLAIVGLVALLPVVVIIIGWAAIVGMSERLSNPGSILWMSPERLADLAAFISGAKRADNLRREWRSHLAGETGAGLPEDRQVRVAAGLVVGAIRYRLQDFADLLEEPVDALLRSRKFSGVFVLVPTLWVSVLFIRQGGLYGLADHLEAVAVVWSAGMGLIHLGRKWRDVGPPERKPRRKNE